MTRRAGLFWGLVMVVVGTLFLLGNLGYIEFTLGTLLSEFWPIVLIYIGARMVSATYGSAAGATVTEGIGDEPAVFLEGETRLIGRYFLGDLVLAVDRPIEGGVLHVGLGNIELDLRRSGAAEGHQVLACLTRVGNVRITMPEQGEWRVEALCLVGDVTVGRDSRDGIAKTVSAESPGYGAADTRLLVRVRAGIGAIVVR
ncbi:MAG: cell wall-active antibiotics response protein [Candidatus Eisenbacteria bacterium]|nr:cell wall-active antibiotics response protein [Candidatus Eisenbacteria bacterium]